MSNQTKAHSIDNSALKFLKMVDNRVGKSRHVIFRLRTVSENE